jgi:hypothetical protein
VVLKRIEHVRPVLVIVERWLVVTGCAAVGGDPLAVVNTFQMLREWADGWSIVMIDHESQKTTADPDAARSGPIGSMFKRACARAAFRAVRYEADGEAWHFENTDENHPIMSEARREKRVNFLSTELVFAALTTHPEGISKRNLHTYINAHTYDPDNGTWAVDDEPPAGQKRESKMAVKTVEGHLATLHSAGRARLDKKLWFMVVKVADNNASGSCLMKMSATITQTRTETRPS